MGRQYFTNVLCLEASIAHGRTVDKVVTVMDLADVSLTNARNKHFLKLFKAMTAIDQNNYPEVREEARARTITPHRRNW